MVEVLRLTKDKGLDPEKVNFTPKHLADLLSMVEKKRGQRPECQKKCLKKYLTRILIRLYI